MKASQPEPTTPTFGRTADESSTFFVLRCCSVSANAGKLLFRCLSRRPSRRPLLRYGPAIPLRRAAVLELDVVGREPQRSYRRQTSSMQRQAQVTGVRGVCKVKRRSVIRVVCVPAARLERSVLRSPRAWIGRQREGLRTPCKGKPRTGSASGEDIPAQIRNEQSL